MKVDPHVHSRFSTRPSQWILQKLNCPESFTDPMKLYRTAKRLGMDLVTISDHNTINGALEIAHLDDAFISVEITTYFPEDGCKAHVLALDIDEDQFRDIQAARENIFDLVPCLRERNITHICAHPLFGVNDRLTEDHVERLLLLFKNLEVNGARDNAPNEVLKGLAAMLTPEIIDQLTDKWNLEPGYPEPWKKNITGGSDDHSALNIARIHTEVPGAASLREFLDGIERGNCRPLGEPAIPETMAHNLYAIAYQYYKNRFGLEKYVNKDIFLRVVDRFLGAEETPARKSSLIDRFQAHWSTRRYLKGAGSSAKVQDICRREAARLIHDDDKLREISKGASLPRAKGKLWYRFTEGASNKVLRHFANTILGQASGGNVFDIFQTLGSAGALYTLLAPYFVSYTLYAQDRRFARAVQDRLSGKPPRQRQPRVGHFTDTFYEVNGVAKTLQRSVDLAQRTGKDLTMITCNPSPEYDTRRPGVRNFQPIGVYDLPEYPQLQIFYPPVLDMLRFAGNSDFTHIHSATPGPIGLTALLIAKLFKLPIYGTYHTQIPQYARKLTGDSGMEDLTWRFTIWYYSQMERVYAPSRATARELEERGLAPHRILVYPRGVDTDLYTPAKRNGFLKKLGVESGVSFLYVGRVSKEKNLHLLSSAYKRLLASAPEANLVIVGDGPYLEEMQRDLADTPTRFTGCLDGEDLAACYASADAFVFPSTTDTFGNVVLEAQASGLPVIVTDSGGPMENMLPGETGLVTRADDLDALVAAMHTMATQTETRRNMGRNARHAMNGRSFEKAFNQTWDFYKKAG
ncbi:glycosyltransferase [Desulfohalovibrio reitneri]|uniref:glycosyltransferase n=1 Tax=Desulfohalovibrio reitneri TaxID=1307759 RepID=UPI0004A6E37F|nr:glycosyltransferase [Desulfohalovibrio reitneri]